MRTLVAILTVVALTAIAAPARAVVGGHDAPAGAFPSVAEITFGEGQQATAARARASPAATRGWPTRRCATGSRPRRRTL